MTARKTVALALGSGGARGWCHIGVLRGLEDLGIRPTAIAGTSMGSVVGASYAAGCLDALEDWATSLSRLGYISMLDVRISGGGLIRGAQIEKLLTDIGVPDSFEDLSLPFTAIATKMETGEPQWFKSGSLKPAIRASSSIPGVLSPAEVNDTWYLDGALSNPVPVDAARAFGADAVLAVNPNGSVNGVIWQRPAPVKASWADQISKAFPDVANAVPGLFPARLRGDVGPSYVDVLSATNDIVTVQMMKARQEAHPPDLLLEAQLSEMTPLEIDRASDAIDEGRRIVEAHAEQILRVCGAD